MNIFPAPHAPEFAAPIRIHDRPEIPDRLNCTEDAARPFMCRIEILVDGVKFDMCLAYDKGEGWADGYKIDEKGSVVPDAFGNAARERRVGLIEVRWI